MELKKIRFDILNESERTEKRKTAGGKPRGIPPVRTRPPFRVPPCFLPAFLAFWFCAVSTPVALHPQNQERRRIQGPEQDGGAVVGVWENSSRFLEFSSDGKMRVVLKPYYAFVYEDAGWIPCAVSEKEGRTFLDPVQGGASLEEGVFSFTVRYPGDRTPSVFSAAILNIGGGESVSGTDAPRGFFTRYYVRQDASTGSGTEESDDTARFSGFWVCGGGGDGVKLYRSPPEDDLFCLYFDGGRYYKIRYWRTDARIRDVQAVFSPEQDGSAPPRTVPKFFSADGFLYTCITGTGTTLRNYESGSWGVAGGAVTLTADRIVYAGAKKTETLPFYFSADGSVLALGAPYAVRSSVNDLDAEIAAHNAKRRPPREPPLELMDLDFHWDEIDELRR